MKLTAISAVLGAVAVGLGAFGAHGLEDSLPAKQLGWWETATFYLLVHAVAALAVSLQDRMARRSAVVMAAGASVFAGTLYAMALGAPTVLGAVTPMGGLLMISGWLLAAWDALRSRKV